MYQVMIILHLVDLYIAKILNLMISGDPNIYIRSKENCCCRYSIELCEHHFKKITKSINCRQNKYFFFWGGRDGRQTFGECRDNLVPHT